MNGRPSHPEKRMTFAERIEPLQRAYREITDPANAGDYPMGNGPLQDIGNSLTRLAVESYGTEPLESILDAVEGVEHSYRDSAKASILRAYTTEAVSTLAAVAGDIRDRKYNDRMEPALNGTLDMLDRLKRDFGMEEIRVPGIDTPLETLTHMVLADYAVGKMERLSAGDAGNRLELASNRSREEWGHLKGIAERNAPAVPKKKRDVMTQRLGKVDATYLQWRERLTPVVESIQDDLHMAATVLGLNAVCFSDSGDSPPQRAVRQFAGFSNAYSDVLGETPRSIEDDVYRLETYALGVGRIREVMREEDLAVTPPERKPVDPRGDANGTSTDAVIGEIHAEEPLPARDDVTPVEAHPIVKVTTLASTT